MPQRLIDAPRRPRLPPTVTRLERERAKADRLEQERLLASVNDLALYLGRLSGAVVRLTASEDPPQPDETAVLVAEVGQARFGALGGHSEGRQTFRIVVDEQVVALFGESDLASSYAVYELLHRLGCRWFMPGELGEVIPAPATLELPATDEVISPSTIYRNLWYSDAAYQRRNRLGGIKLNAGHRLERWITEEQREAHPEWRAVVKGVPHKTRLRWSNPEVADAIAAAIAEEAAKSGAPTASLSPGDGGDFDETLDTQLDAGDWDPAANSVSLTDRLLVLANRVARKLQPTYPDLLLGVLAYSSYTRPPARESVHPNVVPVLAPITLCREHPWSDDSCPGAREARRTVEGWSRAADKVAFRSYAFNLAEPAAPNPMLRKWSYDLPFVLAHDVRFFQPETLPNFETSLPALYLAVRLSWDRHQQPEAILSDLFARFYGHAARATREYIDFIDRAWTQVDEFSGGNLSYARRFPVETRMRAHRLMATALKACETDIERRRLGMLDASLTQFELYMTAAEDLRAGKPMDAKAKYDAWLERSRKLAVEYQPNAAFGAVRWARDDVTAYASYAQRFAAPIYEEGAHIQSSARLLGPRPSCEARFRLASEAAPGPGGPPAQFDGQERMTDFCTETWSTLGLHDYFGSAWYDIPIDTSPSAAGSATYLWLSKVDGAVRVWLNGVELSTAHGAAPETHLKPLTFEASAAWRPAGPNRALVLIDRTRLTELGAGGLLGPIYAYETP